MAATSALRVEGLIRHPPLEEPWEYFVIIAIRNDRGEEVARQVVNVGALAGRREAHLHPVGGDAAAAGAPASGAP